MPSLWTITHQPLRNLITSDIQIVKREAFLSSCLETMLVFIKCYITVAMRIGEKISMVNHTK